ncbi:MAG: hypothetical protein LRY67_04425 [Gammaproteobacteria bacterium]|nr:hypothetical protein [Gammaproteobacteria bacterium]MCD8543020.1 hypothetical protein [Gammaproteobacteria bacterium]
MPESSSSTEIPAHLANFLPNIDINAAEELAPIEHVFSHYKLIATPIRYTLLKNTQTVMSHTIHLWHNPKHELPKGLPAPIKKWLALYDEQNGIL